MAFGVNVKDISRSPEIKLLELEGELDNLGSKTFSEEILPVIEGGCVHLVLDLSNLTYINSTGIYIILRCFTKTKEKKGFLKLSGANKQVGEILELTGITKIIPSYNTLDEALNDVLPS